MPQAGQRAEISLGKRVFEKIPSEARSNEDNNEERKAGKKAVEMGQQGRRLDAVPLTLAPLENKQKLVFGKPEMPLLKIE